MIGYIPTLNNATGQYAAITGGDFQYNPNGVSNINFNEAIISQIENGVPIQPIPSGRNLSLFITDPSASFSLVDPATLAVTDHTMTYAEAAQILVSLGRLTQIQADASGNTIR